MSRVVVLSIFTLFAWVQAQGQPPTVQDLQWDEVEDEIGNRSAVVSLDTGMIYIGKIDSIEPGVLHLRIKGRGRELMTITRSEVTEFRVKRRSRGRRPLAIAAAVGGAAGGFFGGFCALYCGGRLGEKAENTKLAAVGGAGAVGGAWLAYHFARGRGREVVYRVVK